MDVGGGEGRLHAADGRVDDDAEDDQNNGRVQVHAGQRCDDLQALAFFLHMYPDLLKVFESKYR